MTPLGRQIAPRDLPDDFDPDNPHNVRVETNVPTDRWAPGEARPGYSSVPLKQERLDAGEFKRPLGIAPVPTDVNSLGPNAAVPPKGVIPTPNPVFVQDVPVDTLATRVEQVIPTTVAASPVSQPETVQSTEMITVDWHGSQFPITFDKVWYQPSAGNLPGFVVLIHNKDRDPHGPRWRPPSEGSQFMLEFQGQWFKCVHVMIELSLPLDNNYVLMALPAEPVYQDAS